LAARARRDSQRLGDATLQPGLVRATASQDRRGPVSRIDPGMPRDAGGGWLEVTGVAEDVGGGVVGGVEVSVDGGASWHPAAGTTRWTYRWRPEGASTGALLSRAVDDSGNLEEVRVRRDLTTP
jgi:hypothetical protein